MLTKRKDKPKNITISKGLWKRLKKICYLEELTYDKLITKLLKNR